ncbi:hypothetical protein ACSFA8_24475 [Variovorax sp. RT4R15]|uniref:hypothetical protein n=1 Tax=Variovorax sp. RT4R15 TaxID=3443737 RepID=UPI003F46700F
MNDTQQDIVKVARTDIVKKPEWQVRESLNATRVKHYRSVYKLGATMPPIELADIKGTLYLVDGWHRCEAQTELGWTHFEATILKMTASEAEWRAAKANLAHGESYKKPERRRAFGKFISTKQNKPRGGKLMSYREMAVAFGGDPSHVTIRKWVEQDHPTLFKALEKNRGGEWSPDMLEPRDAPSEEQRDVERFQTLLAEAVAQSRSIQSATGRKGLDTIMKKAHDAIIKRQPYKVIPVERAPDDAFL